MKQLQSIAIEAFETPSFKILTLGDRTDNGYKSVKARVIRNRDFLRLTALRRAAARFRAEGQGEASQAMYEALDRLDASSL